MTPPQDPTSAVRAWLREEPPSPPDRRAVLARVIDRLPETRRRRRWWPSATGFPGGRRAMSFTLRLATAAAVVALTGFVASGTLLRPPTVGPAAPVAVGSAEPWDGASPVPVPVATVAPAAVTSAELSPTGAQRILPGSMVPYQLASDGDGGLWAYGDRLLRFSERDGTLAPSGEWSIVDDLAFGDATIAPARGGGVWIVDPSLPTSARAAAPLIRHFDGTGFTRIIEMPPGYPGAPSLSSIAEGPDGTLWAVADTGAWRWDGTAWSSMKAPFGADLLAIDTRGGAWIASAGHVGLSRFDGTSWRDFTADDHPALGAGILELEASLAGGVLVDTSDAVLAFDGTAWTAIPFPASTIPASSLAADATGDVWLARDGELFLSRAGGAFEQLRGLEDVPDGYPTPPLVALADGIVTTGPDGLYLVRDGKASAVWMRRPGPDVYTEHPGSRVATSTDLWASDASGVWRCSFAAAEGDCRLAGDGLPTAPVEDTPGVMTATSLARAPNGAIWATGPWGTARLESDSWVVIDDAPGISLGIASDGTAWVVSRDGQSPQRAALVAYRPAGEGWAAETVAEREWLLAGWTWIAPLADGSVWTGQRGYFGALARFDGEAWEDVTLVGDRPFDGGHDTPSAAADPAGKHLWLVIQSGDEGWAIHLDGAEATASRDLGNILELPTAGLVAAPDGSAWVGGIGLRRLDASGSTPVGFEGRFVEPLALTEDGSLIFQSGAGIYRLPAR